jgi:hypothetical protein
VTQHLGGRLCPLVDGQLCHDERDRALAHLANCLACRAQVVEYRRMKQRLAGLCPPALPETLTDRLLGLDLAVVAGQPGQAAGAGTARVVARQVSWRPGLRLARDAAGPLAVSGEPGPGAGGRRAAWSWRRPEPAFFVTGAAVVLRLGPHRRRAASPPGLSAVLVVGAVVEAHRPVAGRPVGSRRRMRRTVLSSAALMLLTVTAAALGDQATVGAASQVRPSTVPASPLPANNSGPAAPLVAPVSFVGRR